MFPGVFPHRFRDLPTEKDQAPLLPARAALRSDMVAQLPLQRGHRHGERTSPVRFARETEGWSARNGVVCPLCPAANKSVLYRYINWDCIN